MSKKNQEQPTKSAEDQPLDDQAVVEKKRSYFIPTIGKSVEATSREEALKLATEQEEEGGDGNI